MLRLALLAVVSASPLAQARRPLSSADIDDIATLVKLEDTRQFDAPTLTRSVPLKKIFTDPVAAGGFGLTVSAIEMQLPYIVSLAMFAVTMPLVGKYIEKMGPRKVGMIGGVVVGLGWILASFATSPITLALLYGFVAGVGVGIAYGCPITTAARWFPDKRGLAVGLTLLGFGFSAFITGKVADMLTASVGIFNAFRFLGVAFLALIVVLSMFLVFPPACPRPSQRDPRDDPPFARARGRKRPGFLPQ